MMNQIAFSVVFLSSAVANPSDVLRQCEMHSDCGANHYCLYTYCERCIPCDRWFNRQPAIANCARVDDDCGVCLPGYQAHDFTDQRRSMKCFPMHETVEDQSTQLTSNLLVSIPVHVLIATTAMTLLMVLITMLVVRIGTRRPLNYQIKVLDTCATIPPYSEPDTIPVDEEDGFIGAEASETAIHLFQIHRNLDDPPTYEQAVSNVHRERNSKAETDIPLMESHGTCREFSAELKPSSEPMSSIALGSMLMPGTSTDCAKNPPMEVMPAVNRIVNKDVSFSSIIQSAASSSEAQVSDTGVTELEHVTLLTLKRYLVNEKPTNE